MEYFIWTWFTRWLQVVKWLQKTLPGPSAGLTARALHCPSLHPIDLHLPPSRTASLQSPILICRVWLHFKLWLLLIYQRVLTVETFGGFKKCIYKSWFTWFISSLAHALLDTFSRGWSQGKFSLMYSCRCRANRMSELERALNTPLDYSELFENTMKGISVNYDLNPGFLPLNLFWKRYRIVVVTLCGTEGSKVSMFSHLPSKISSCWLWLWDHAGKSEEYELSFPNDKQFGVLDCLGVSGPQLAICKYSRTQETAIWNVSCLSMLDKEDSACDKVWLTGWAGRRTDVWIGASSARVENFFISGNCM